MRVRESAHHYGSRGKWISLTDGGRRTKGRNKEAFVLPGTAHVALLGDDDSMEITQELYSKINFKFLQHICYFLG